tara:strand:+ start:1491 stop:2027 length:537 start_codon:yes stop_codon:yes gene_type:complete
MKPKSTDLKRIVQLVGALNAALWLGGALFFTFFAGPVFFDPALEGILPPPENGIAARFLIGRFTAFQLACGILAGLILLIGWRMRGGPFPCGRTLLLAGVMAFILIGAFYLTPRLDQLHELKYAGYFDLNATTDESAAAAKAFGPLHGVSQVGNLVVLLGLMAHFIWEWKETAGERVG